jgi:hypothetical protein
MVLASLLGIFAIPPLYVSFQSIREKLRPSVRPKEHVEEGQPDHRTEIKPMQPPAAAE